MDYVSSSLLPAEVVIIQQFHFQLQNNNHIDIQDSNLKKPVNKQAYKKCYRSYCHSWHLDTKFCS